MLWDSMWLFNLKCIHRKITKMSLHFLSRNTLKLFSRENIIHGKEVNLRSANNFYERSKVICQPNEVTSPRPTNQSPPCVQCLRLSDSWTYGWNGIGWFRRVLMRIFGWWRPNSMTAVTMLPLTSPGVNFMSADKIPSVTRHKTWVNTNKKWH